MIKNEKIMFIDRITIKRKLIIVISLLVFTSIISIFLMIEMGKISQVQKMERDHLEAGILLKMRFEEYFKLLESDSIKNATKAEFILNAKSDNTNQMGIIALHKRGSRSTAKRFGTYQSVRGNAIYRFGLR